MAIIEANHLVKKYQVGNEVIRAVDDVSFSVEQGEFISIVGASGSGKSTLLHLLGCVEKPDAGEIIIDNKKVSDLNMEQLTIFRRRQIGLIYQFFNLLPILTVTENITLPYQLDSQKVNENEVKELLERLEMTHRKDHLPGQLSGGEQQRVAIGRALMTKPTIILADEPTGNLDSVNSKQIIDLLIKANQELNQTIIMITHDLEIAQQAKRMLRMADGKIVEDVRLR